MLLRSIIPQASRTFVIGALVASAFVAGIAIRRPTSTIVTPPAIAIPPVTVALPTVIVFPAPPVVTPAPAPVASTPEPPPAGPEPRALAPMIDPSCVVSLGEASTPSSPTCAWSDGFPAVSLDGRFVATKYAGDSDASGMHELTIHVIDVTTSRVVRELAILDRSESGEFLYPQEDPDGKLQAERDKLLAKIYTRTATANAALAKIGFRSMTALGDYRETMDEADRVYPKDRVYAQIAGGMVRIVDPVAGTMLWRGFLEGGSPPAKRDPDRECGGWGIWSMAVHWDAKTKVVFADESIRTGGCMCPDVSVQVVRRIP